MKADQMVEVFKRCGIKAVEIDFYGANVVNVPAEGRLLAAHAPRPMATGRLETSPYRTRRKAALAPPCGIGNGEHN